MTTLRDDITSRSAGGYRLALAGAALISVPALWLKLGGGNASHPIEAVLFGLAIVGAAFLLSWAAEVAQLDISAGLAIAVLALIAVLPEYAVDFVFAWEGGQAVREFGATCPGVDDGESPCSLALANMTGANRLLIGVGWSMVVFIAWYRTRRRNAKAAEGSREVIPWRGVQLERSHTVELSFLAIATVYSLTLPLKSSITLIDSIVLVGVFALYTIRIARAPAEEPHLVGPARYVGSFSVRGRRTTIAVMFVFAAIVILLCAEPFAHALVETGESYGISQFFLVQWLAPLASEAPEFIVAGLFAWRLNTNSALGTLVSSKVNQWTLLVGSLPIVFAISSNSLHGLPIAGSQREEILLTAAQSLFAVAMLINLRMSVFEAGWIFGLFWAQFLASAFIGDELHDEILLINAGVYLVVGIIMLVRNRRETLGLMRDGLRTPYAHLTAQR